MIQKYIKKHLLLVYILFRVKFKCKRYCLIGN